MGKAYNLAVVQGLVSTIIPVHNRPKLIVEAVNSVLNQTYRPLEVIIIDDGSSDETAEICDQIARDNQKSVRVIHHANCGPGFSREAGRLLARGEFIQYLDSDDLLLPAKFELQVAALRSEPHCGVSYGRTRFNSIDGTASDAAWKRTGERIETMFPSMLEARWWGTSTPLYRRSVVDGAGPWTDLKSEEDWEYDCRIASQGVYLNFVSEFVSEERDHRGDRLSRNGSSDKSKLSDRARAHQLILSHARGAGLSETQPEMQFFARELFLLARQCGAAGLASESRMLFNLARDASGEVRARGWDFRIYGLLAEVAGWTRLGKMACYSDSIRK